jgi:hypothetical protein
LNEIDTVARRSQKHPGPTAALQASSPPCPFCFRLGSPQHVLI